MNDRTIEINKRRGAEEEEEKGGSRRGRLLENGDRFTESNEAIESSPAQPDARRERRH